MTNEVPNYVKTYVVLDDGETYAELDGCTIVRVTEEGQELMEDMDVSAANLLEDYEPDGLYQWTYLCELLDAVYDRLRHHEHKEAA